MKITVSSFDNGSKIPDEFCFCVPAEHGNITMGKNFNPKISWEDYPSQTKSFALICVDPDVPSDGTDVNQEGKTVAIDLPRIDFYHWIVADIPININVIEKGQDSKCITPRGKIASKFNYGTTGINDYTKWFEGDEDMSGNYGGYDGPCPPWNDERIHHYHFKVFALDIESTNLQGNFNGSDLINAIENHILDSAEFIGLYSLNKNIII